MINYFLKHIFETFLTIKEAKKSYSLIFWVTLYCSNRKYIIMHDLKSLLPVQPHTSSPALALP